MFTAAEQRLLRTGIFRVRNGARSFYASVRSPGSNFFRYDPGCMEAMGSEAMGVLDMMRGKSIASHGTSLEWSAGKILVIDNWKVLHGRDAVLVPEARRTLLRFLVR
jgi:hypothetical protein